MAMEKNFALHIPLSSEQKSKRSPYCMSLSADGNPMRMAMPGSRVEHSDNEPEVQQFVAIIPILGPITRNGGACSYGSIDVRDAMIEAADDECCAGIILYINSGGGAVDAIPDFKYGKAYAASKNVPVDALIDGTCGSAAFYAATECDHRYYINERDQIGSIGVYAAFYTQTPGEKNVYTNETFHQVYATQSYRKNKWYRDAAEGDYKELQANLDSIADEFIADVKKACPKATEEHLTGELFNAKDVEGILVDGQSTLIECIQRMTAQHASSNPRNVKSSTTQTNINMQNYPLINAAINRNPGDLVVTEEGTHFDAALLDALEAHLSAQQQEIATLKEASDKQQEAIYAAVTKVNAEHATAVETLKAEHASAVEALKAEFGEKEKSLNARITELEAGAEAHSAEMQKVKEALATAEQTIADKDAQIAELSNDPGNEPAQGAAPQNNGEGAQVKTLREFDPSQYKTCAERKAAFEAFKRGEQV